MDTSPAAVAQRVHTFRERCEALGLSLTPQRLAVYQMLASTGEHPGAEDIYQRLKPSIPSLSRGTVYRTLTLFESHGLVSRVPVSDDQARFDANLDNHHHLVCVRCQRVADIQDTRLDQLSLEHIAPQGFKVSQHRVYLLGLCQSCQQQGNEPEA
jgi:Fur family peroxide stress response transcriptional regulator